MTAAIEVGVSGQQHAPAALYPRERPGTHFTGGWVGPRAGLDGRKILSPPGFDPGPSSPLAQSLYPLSYRAHVALGTQHAMRTRHIVICSLFDSAVFLHAVSYEVRFLEKEVT